MTDDKNEKGGLIFDLEAQKLILEDKLAHAKAQAEESIAREAAIDAVKALEDGKISVDGDIEKAQVLSDVLKAISPSKLLTVLDKPTNSPATVPTPLLEM